MNGLGSEEAVIVTTQAAEASIDSRTRAGTSSEEGDWLCAWCMNRVANERDRFQFEGKDEFGFANPAGVHFDIILFTQTLGCRETGMPTLDYTWFAGHAWSFCQCDRCGCHLGWYYAGQYEFTGLVKDRIVRALQVRN